MVKYNDHRTIYLVPNEQQGCETMQRIKEKWDEKYPGTLISFSERSADVRLVQYETGSRKPKTDVTACIGTGT